MIKSNMSNDKKSYKENLNRNKSVRISVLRL